MRLRRIKVSAMTPDTKHDQPSPDNDRQPLDGEVHLSAEQLRQLADAELQARFRQEALEQLRRRQCPGCGEMDLF